VDVRVLPVLFRFQKPKDIQLYPGQLVDVYIGEEGYIAGEPHSREEASVGEKTSEETQVDATLKGKGQERTGSKP
jgi:HlyD family secretion protein